MLQHTNSPRTMEEVWKDINLASLNDRPTRDHHQLDHTSAAAAAAGMILQDFLAKPFTSKDPPPPPPSTRRETHHNPLFASPAALPSPATVLSLNSGPDFHFLDTNLETQHAHIANPFEALASSVSFGRRRVQDSNGGSNDRRHKRMIKNRESAARSRARKQAYTNELELEVAHLLEENAKLRRQQEQICIAAAAQLPKKHTLHRTSTAPF